MYPIVRALNANLDRLTLAPLAFVAALSLAVIATVAFEPGPRRADAAAPTAAEADLSATAASVL